MLILTRRIGENLVITLPEGEELKKLAGTQFTVGILSVKGNQVRTGIDAPKSITVHREEIQQRVDAGLSPEENWGNR